MNRLIIIIALFLASNLLYSAKPIVEVGSILPEEQLEYFEDSDELFAMKVMEYYQKALLLQAQLEMMGIVPVQEVTQPSIEELEDLEVEIIVKYYIIARRLENQIIQAPETDRAAMQLQIESLERAINDTVAHYIRVKRDLGSKVQERTVELLNECDSVVNAKMTYLEDQFFRSCYDAVPLVSASGIASYIFLNGSDALQNDISLGVKLRLNLGKLLGVWNGLGVWYEYAKPRFTTESFIGDQFIDELWNTDLHSVGGNIQFDLHKSQRYNDGLNFTAGYFWCEADIYNKQAGSYFNMSGLKLSAEYLASIPSCRYPFDIYLRFDIYSSFDDETLFQTGNAGVEPIPVDNTLPGIAFGLRYNFFRSFE